ncbi:carbohydrate kinase family protein [Methanobacterium sp. ACI-7]|uniref:carbohydrate kinase family protein n=1 Tax=unclassified Methanobacterium TaxID=2627676 RepID=UPI0039C2FA25
MKKIDVIGFGALNVDKLYNVNKITYEDEETFITDFNEFCGGSAANTIIGLSKLGIKTGFIGKIAEDHEGYLLLNNLQQEEVNTDWVIISPTGRSGNVLGFVDKNGQRALYVDPGVNDLIKYGELEIDYVNNSKVLHLTSFVGNSFKAQEEVLKIIDEDVMVSLDPGRIYAERGIDFLKNILNRTDVILINEEELKHLTGNKYKTCKEGAEFLLDFDISYVVIKRGDKGSYVTDGNESYHIKPFEVNCIDTTGAGDAFNAGFLYGLLKNKDIEQSGKLGNFTASCCITESGAIKGLPNIDKLINK